MMFKRVIDFIRLRWIFIGFSIFTILAGIAGYIVNGGFNLSIDFTSGLAQQFRIDPAGATANIAQMRSVLAPLDRFDLQVLGNPQDQEFLVKVLAPQADSEFQSRTETQILDLLGQAFGAGNVKVLSSDFVGPRYSSELATQTIWILLVAIIGILIYAAFRFQIIYGTAAVLTTVHDALFMVAVTAIFRIEFTTTTVAAILTIIGYSINDTIVIFDRVRENRGLMREAELGTILNTSITQTLGRTILTNTTVLLSIIALYVLGSGDIKNFALLMIIGVFEGTYSTIFIASPIVYMWSRANDRRRKARELAKYGRVTEGAQLARERREPEPAMELAQPELIPQGPGPYPEAPEFAEHTAEGAVEAEGEAPAVEKPALAPQPAPLPQPSPVSGAGAQGYTRVQPVRRHKKRRR
jgi:preprotein translocase subunit SecF